MVVPYPLVSLSLGRQGQEDYGGEDMVRKLGTFAALVKDPSLVPRTHIRQLTTCSRGSDVLFWSISDTGFSTSVSLK